MDAIAKEQVTAPNKDFYGGMFPSYRECAGSPHNYQPDNNIFYTAVSVFALKNMLPYLSEANRRKAAAIMAKATANFYLFRHKSGLPIYGFWASKDKMMPHTYIFQYMKGVFGQSEDADDSVMALMGLDDNDSNNAALKKGWLKPAT